MAEWIGQVISSWPFWAVAGVLVVVFAAYLFYNLTYLGDWPFSKREWWQDKEKRLAKANNIKQEKLRMKAKKG